MTDPPAETTDPAETATLTDVLAAYAGGGFTTSFASAQGSRVECHECGRQFPAADASMSSLRRMEGASDPADMLAVVALTCPLCDARGTLVLGFGPAAAPEDGDVLGVLRDHRADPGVPQNAAPGEGADGNGD